MTEHVAFSRMVSFARETRIVVSFPPLSCLQRCFCSTRIHDGCLSDFIVLIVYTTVQCQREGCFPIYYLRNQNVFVHLWECLQFAPDTLVASVRGDQAGEVLSSINICLLKFQCSLAIIVCSTVVTWLSWAYCIGRRVLSTTGPFHFTKYPWQCTNMRKAVRPRPGESGLRNRDTWVWNAKVSFELFHLRDKEWKLHHLMEGISGKDT